MKVAITGKGGVGKTTLSSAISSIICIAEIYQPRCAQLIVPEICVVNTGEEAASMATKSILITKRD